jgi:uncharacterized DUF497 family protein
MITFDSAKRDKTLADRGLDFADAETVFAGPNLTVEDDRFDYGEVRYSTVGRLRGRMVMVIWTPRGDARHVISMRKTNDREKARFGQQLEQG